MNHNSVLSHGKNNRKYAWGMLCMFALMIGILILIVASQEADRLIIAVSYIPFFTWIVMLIVVGSTTYARLTECWTMYHANTPPSSYTIVRLCFFMSFWALMHYICLLALISGYMKNNPSYMGAVKLIMLIVTFMILSIVSHIIQKKTKESFKN